MPVVESSIDILSTLSVLTRDAELIMLSEYVLEKWRYSLFGVKPSTVAEYKKWNLANSLNSLAHLNPKPEVPQRLNNAPPECTYR
jgi:hypothetical protein